MTAASSCSAPSTGAAPSRANGERSCGVAQLFERRADGWARLATIRPEADLAHQVQFGQAVASMPLAPSRWSAAWASLAVRRIGRLCHRRWRASDLAQTLAPETHLGGFAADLACRVTDGGWPLAGTKSVYSTSARAGLSCSGTKLSRQTPRRLFRRDRGAVRRGRRLFTGAPRTDCAKARVRRGLRLRHGGPGVSPARSGRQPRPRMPTFGHHLALKRRRPHAAVQGAVIHVFALGDGAGLRPRLRLGHCPCRC